MIPALPFMRWIRQAAARASTARHAFPSQTVFNDSGSHDSTYRVDSVRVARSPASSDLDCQESHILPICCGTLDSMEVRDG